MASSLTLCVSQRHNAAAWPGRAGPARAAPAAGRFNKKLESI
jgi:hypothetical protein